MADKNTNKDIKEIKRPGQILDYVDTKEHLVELFNYINNLQEELKYQKEAEREYNEKHTKLMKKYKESQSRIDKAIEYFTRRDIEWGSYEQKVLLDILRGKDDNSIYNY